MKIAVASLGLLVAVACGGASSPLESQAAATPSPTSTEKSGSQAFDRLTITLHLASNEVRSGGGIESELVIENESDRAVTDPECLLYAPRFALVPEEDPNAELWGAIVVDCSGPRVIHPGEEERSSGPTFRATDKYGEPLPPGRYLAVMDLERRSENLIEPVTVTEE